jgi:hypothetical protein
VDELKTMPLDKKREVLLIDSTVDNDLADMLKQFAEQTVAEESGQGGEDGSENAGNAPAAAGSADTRADARGAAVGGLVGSDGGAISGTSSVRKRPNARLDRVIRLAKLVCERMGGQVEPVRLPDLGYKFKVTEAKLRLNSNVIPIGALKVGGFYHRALLFKAIADRFDIPCSLHRGDYGRAWNVVALRSAFFRAAGRDGSDKSGSTGIPSGLATAVAAAADAGATAALPFRSGAKAANGGDDISSELGFPANTEDCYIVDLMHEPGRFLKLSTAEAVAYQRIQA